MLEKSRWEELCECLLSLSLDTYQIDGYGILVFEEKSSFPGKYTILHSLQRRDIKGGNRAGLVAIL